MTYNVHLYVTVRVKVEDIEADNQVQAIEEAESLCEDSLARMFQSRASTEFETEYADEITEYLVDEVGDESFQRSMFYDADRKPNPPTVTKV
jgi:hypothetical protein